MPSVPYLNQTNESLSDELGNMLSVKMFGAKGDVVEVGDAQMTAGSNIIYSPAGFFTPADVGKVGGMPGAGRTTDPIRIVYGGLLGGLTTSNTLTVVCTGNFFGSMIAGGYVVFSGYYSDWGGPVAPVNWSIYGSNASNFSDENPTPLYSGSFDSLFANPNDRDVAILTWNATSSTWTINGTTVGSYKYWRVKAVSGTSSVPAGILVNVAQWGPMLPFTVTGYTDAQHITVSLNAVSTVANPLYCYWGTPDDTAFANALNALYQFNSYGLTGGDRLTIPKGAYLLTKPLVIVGNEHLVGDSAALYFDPARFTLPNYTNPGGQLVNYLVALSEPGAGGSTFGAFLESVDIYCNNIPASAVYIETAQEQSDLIRISVHDYNGMQGNPAIFFFGNGSQNCRASRLWVLGGLANQPQPKTYFTGAITGSSSSQTVAVNRTDWMGAVGSTVVLQAGFFALGTEGVTCTIASATTVTGVFLNNHAVNDAIMPAKWPICIDLQYLGGRCDIHDCTLVPGYEAPWGVGIRNLSSPATIDNIHFEAAQAGILIQGGNGAGRLFYGLANVTALAYIVNSGGFRLSALHAGPGNISPITVYDSTLGVARGGYYTQEYSSDPSISYVESGIGDIGSQNFFTDPTTLVPQLQVTPQNGVSMRQCAFGSGSGPTAPYRPMAWGNRASTEYTQWVQRGNSGGIYELQSSHTSGTGATPFPGIMFRMDTDNANFGWFWPGLLAFGDGSSTTWPHDASTLLQPLQFGNTISNCWYRWVQTGANGRTMKLQYSSNSSGTRNDALAIDATTGAITMAGFNPAYTVPVTIALTADGIPLTLSCSDPSYYAQMVLAGTGRSWALGVGNASESVHGVANKFYLYDGAASAIRLVCDTSGYVGIGTTAPSLPLHVVSPVAAALFQSNSGNGSIGIQASDGKRFDVGVGTIGSSYSDAFYIGDDPGSPRLVIDSSGNVHVVGNFAIDSITSGSSGSPAVLGYDGTKVVTTTAGLPAPTAGFTNEPLAWTGSAWTVYSPALMTAFLQSGVAIPTSHSSTGSQGQFCSDANYLYHCIQTNLWMRIGVSGNSITW